MRARDNIILKASSAGGIFTVGALPDRENISKQNIEITKTARADSAGEQYAQCVGSFNRKKDEAAYRKPAKLTEVLTMLFNEDNKLKASVMRQRMSKMIDPVDGGLLFCPSKEKTNGRLLSEDTIQQFITRMAQEKKKNSKSSHTESIG